MATQNHLPETAIARELRKDSIAAEQHSGGLDMSDPLVVATALELGKQLLDSSEGRTACDYHYELLDHKPDDDRLLAAALVAEERWVDGLLQRCLIRDCGYRSKERSVTALVSTYGSGPTFMRECMEDLQSQTMADDLEVIVVDAASPDNEGEVVAEFQKEYGNIRYVRTPERVGIYPAWNIAIRLSRAEFISTFSTNDRLNPQAYAALRTALVESPETALVYGDSYLTDLPHQSFGRHAPSRFGSEYRWPAYDFEHLLRSCLVGPHPMWRRDVHREVGYFDGRYTAIGDQDFWNRMGWRYRFQHIQMFTGMVWVTDESLSRQPGAPTEIREIKAKHQRHFQRVKRQADLRHPTAT
jgi:hypothetical protein